MSKAIIIKYSYWSYNNSRLMFYLKFNFRVGLMFYLLFSFNIQDVIAQNKSESKSFNASQLKIGDTRLLYLPNSDSPTEVHISFHLQDVDEINDQLETFHLVGFLNLKWFDPRQSFDPEKIGVTEKIYQGNYQFNELAPSWYPQIEIVNISGELEEQSVLMRVKPDGSCNLTQSINVLVKSRLILNRYPFDSQQLKVIFKILGYNNKEVVFITDSNSITSNSELIRIPQWDLTALSASVQKLKTPYSKINDVSSCAVFNLDVERKSFFMVRLIIIPLTLIVFLSWSVFWMGQSSLGDRMSVSFVGILTAVTYQVLVAEILPQISYYTLIHSFLGINFMVMCLTVMINLIVGAYDKKGNQEAGDKLDSICRWAFPIVYIIVSFSQVIFFY